MHRKLTSFTGKRVLPLFLLLAGLCGQQGALASANAEHSLDLGIPDRTPILLSQVSTAQTSEQPAMASTTVNQPPVIEKVNFEPNSPVTGDKLRALVQVIGHDSSQPKLFYRWKINGQVVNESWDGNLECPFKRGDIIEVEVTPTDGFTNGTVRTHSTLAGNAAPTLRIVGQTMDNQGTYQARLEAEDPEGDPIIFSMKSGPKGMTVDPTAGTILWAAEPGVDGDCSIQVSAKDEPGAETILNYRLRARWQKDDGAEEHATTKPASK